MLARDVMSVGVVTAEAGMPLVDVVKLMLEHNVSALPVLDEDGALAGIVSEGDLIQRDEIGTLPSRSWWLSAIGTRAQLADEFIKSHGTTAGAVMTTEVVTAKPDTPLQRVAELLERKKIKRLPVVENGKVVGIVSRANLLQALALQQAAAENAPGKDDRALRERLLEALKSETWADTSHLNVIAKDGVIHLWGQVRSQPEREALIEASRGVAGVKDVVDHTDRTVTVF